mgnify:CR=1 FL=1
MPTAYVQKMAEKHGVSVETAEHKWQEAKHSVKKGKRRGSWYWGKVMNTFKRMMGESTAVTFSEWLLFEADRKTEETLLQAVKNRDAKLVRKVAAGR